METRNISSTLQLQPPRGNPAIAHRSRRVEVIVGSGGILVDKTNYPRHRKIPQRGSLWGAGISVQTSGGASRTSRHTHSSASSGSGYTHQSSSQRQPLENEGHAHFGEALVTCSERATHQHPAVRSWVDSTRDPQQRSIGTTCAIVTHTSTSVLFFGWQPKRHTLARRLSLLHGSQCHTHQRAGSDRW